MDLAGKNAVVTGSSSGIGQSIAGRLASEGANIVIDYHRKDEGAQETRKLVEAAGAKAAIVKADLSVLAGVDRLVDEALKTFGKIDILVNNAGIEKRNH